MAAEFSNAYKVGFCIVVVDFCVKILSLSASKVLRKVQGRNGRQTMLTKEIFSMKSLQHTRQRRRGKKAKKFFIHKILYAPMWKYWREKSIFRFFGALFFSLYAMLSLKHTYIPFPYSHTHQLMFFVRSYMKSGNICTHNMIFFFRGFPRSIKLFFSPSSQWKVVFVPTATIW